MKAESQRLRYETITPSHAPELQEALCDPRVYEFITDHVAPTPDELLQAFHRKASGPPPSRRDETWIDYAVRSMESGVAVGRIEATLLEGHAEVAYLFGPRHWRRGLAFEAMQWLQQLLHAEFGVSDLWATVSAHNTRSLQLLARLGYAQAAPNSWPSRLLTYNPGDQVFHRAVCRSPDVLQDAAPP